jgi:hypothetical protein
MSSIHQDEVTTRVTLDGGYGWAEVRGPYSAGEEAVAIEINTVDRETWERGEAGLSLSVAEASQLVAALNAAIAKAPFSA